LNRSLKKEERRKKEEERRKKKEGRRKKKEGRRKKEEGRRKKEEGRRDCSVQAAESASIAYFGLIRSAVSAVDFVRTILRIYPILLVPSP